MPGRVYSTGSEYRYGFNGKEKSDEISSGAITFEARVYDSRIGRFFSRDPRETEYPWQSTYVYFGNCPTSVLDVNGMGGGEDDPPVKKGTWYRSSAGSDLDYMFVENGHTPESYSYAIDSRDFDSYTPLKDDELLRIVFNKGGNVHLSLNLDGTFDLISPNEKVGYTHGTKKWTAKLANGNRWSVNTNRKEGAQSELFALEMLAGAKIFKFANKGINQGAAWLLKKAATRVLAGQLAKLEFKILQKFQSFYTKELDLFFKSKGKEMISKEAALTYRELATRIVNQTGGAPTSKLTEKALQVQTERIQMIDEALKKL